MRKNITYIFKTYPDESEGITKKVNDTVSLFNRIGYTASKTVASGSILKSTIQIYSQSLKEKSEIYIIRNFPLCSIILFPLLAFKRIIGSKLILDIPTPLTVQVNEIKSSNSSRPKKIIKTIALYMTAPLNNLIFDRVVHYAPESKYFSIFSGEKFFYTTNGVDTKNIPRKENRKRTDQKILNLIAVAHINYWHGIDRLIKSLNFTFKNHKELREIIHLTIVGDGEGGIIPELKELSGKLNLDSNIEFTGRLQPYEASQKILKSDIGVCALGLYKKKLDSAAQLKAREYVAHGLPIILSGDDPDFRGEIPFVFKVKNDDSLIDLNEIYKKYNEYLENHDPSEIREFAEQNLDLSKKIINQYL